MVAQGYALCEPIESAPGNYQGAKLLGSEASRGLNKRTVRARHRRRHAIGFASFHQPINVRRPRARIWLPPANQSRVIRDTSFPLLRCVKGMEPNAHLSRASTMEAGERVGHAAEAGILAAWRVEMLSNSRSTPAALTLIFSPTVSHRRDW